MKKKSDKQSRNFWRRVENASKEILHWPDWKRETFLENSNERRTMKKEQTRKPTSPYEVLTTEFLTPYNISLQELSDHIGFARHDEFCEKLQNHTLDPISWSKIGQSVGVSKEFFLNLQHRLKVWESHQIEDIPLMSKVQRK